MREKLLSIGDDFWIEPSAAVGPSRWMARLCACAIRWFLEDPRGSAVYEIQAKVVAIKDTMAVSKPHGREVAVVKHALISPLHNKMSANMAERP